MRKAFVAKDGREYSILTGKDADRAVERGNKVNFLGCENVGTCPDCGGNCDMILNWLQKELHGVAKD